MDEQRTRDHIDRHADAVVRGDMDAVVGDLTEDLRPHATEIGEVLPQPVTSADVLSVEFGDPESVALIRYSGPASAVTIRSRSQDEDGRPMIVHAEPVEE